MNLTTLGDGALSFLTQRKNVDIRDRLSTLALEMSSGKKADLTKALGGDTVMLRDIDRQLTLARSQSAAATQVGQRLEAVQLNFDAIDVQRQKLVDELIIVNAESSAEQRASVSAAGRIAFESIAGSLNAQFAGQSLFAGRASDGPALAPSDDMHAALRTVAAGATDAASAIALIEDWFDTPGGGFETLGYVGDETGQMERRLNDGTTVKFEARADDQSIRDMLKGAAIAALAHDTTLPITDRDRTDMLSDANIRMIGAATPLAALRARVGQQESRVETALTTARAQDTALSILRNELDRADPFETAGKLQEVQTQLETHYTVTARLSRLSLVEYLR